MILSFFPPSLSQALIDPESDIKPSDSHECGFQAGIGVPASSARGWSYHQFREIENSFSVGLYPKI